MDIVREVPISYLLARHKPYGFRLAKFPKRFVAPYKQPTETKEEKARMDKLEAYWKVKDFFKQLAVKEFEKGDAEFWVAFPPETHMVICRGCGLPVRILRASRKEHLRSGKCATIIHMLEKEVQKSPWCSTCGKLNFNPTYWSWNFKFCSHECMDRFRISLEMAGPTVQRLKIIRKQFEIY